LIEAVLIASPHHTHAVIAADALASGLHVLSEKPIARHLAEAQQLLAGRPDSGQHFAVMLNQRMNPVHQRLKQLIEEQRLGRLQRINWICTPWFRTQAYYRSASWRGTWAGEGGGLLMTLCLHQLDILQWLCGLPTSLRAFGAFGKHHEVEVEDEVTAYLQFPGGASGVFVGSSGEYPGTNRLELVGTKGRALLDDGTLRFVENEIPSDEFIRTSDDGWAHPKTRLVNLPGSTANEGEHSQILRNFARSIRERETLLTPATEGLGSLELAGAMLLSMFQKRAVELPLDSAELAHELELRTAPK
jgi:predicted dehydrogenase